MTFKFQNKTIRNLVIILIVIFIAQEILKPQGIDLVKIGGLHYYSIFNNHEYYRLITSWFLHGGIMHLLNNILVLIVIDEYSLHLKHKHFWIIFSGSAIFADIASLLINTSKGIISVGASGGIAGLLSALFVYSYSNKYTTHYKLLIRKFASSIITFNFVYSVMIPSQNVDHAAHIGGLIGGALIAYLLEYKNIKTSEE